MQDRYDPLRAEPNHCLVACIAMIARAVDGGREWDQFEIAEMLGGITDEGLGLSDIGMPVRLDAWRNLPLLGAMFRTAEYVLSNSFDEWELDSYLSRGLQGGGHAVVTLSAGSLYRHSQRERGHAVLVEAVEGDVVQIIDPGPETFGRAVYPAIDLYWASRARTGGLILLPRWQWDVIPSEAKRGV